MVSSKKEEYRRYSQHDEGLSVYLRRYHYYVHENSALYKIHKKSYGKFPHGSVSDVPNKDFNGIVIYTSMHI